MTLQFRCRVIFFVPHGTVWAMCVARSRLNKRDPACWRPARGAGFDCAALFGCVARPYTRCAASLRMTRGLQGRGTIYVWYKI